jgi:hypothetical protein
MVTGAIIIIIGILKSDTYESGLSMAFFGTYDLMPTCLLFGGLCIVLGIIIFIVGLRAKPSAIKIQPSNIIDHTETIVKIRCPQCQSLNDETARYCVRCGNLLKIETLKENNI